MEALIEKLSAEGGGESVTFLNDIVARLWPHINVAASKMIKEIAEPMFKTMLPGPLASLHFTKLDLGTVPLTLSNVIVSKTEADDIKMDLNVDWNGKPDIDLDGTLIPTLGVKSVALFGRLSIILGPTTDIIPLIGAAQITFVNPPVLKLDFTGAAEFADLDMIDGAVRGIIIGIINSIVVMPNRLLVKLDATNDYFKTQLSPLGIIRITAEKATGFADAAKSTASKLFSKITRESPDAYCKISVGAEELWKTSTKKNTTSPIWDETHDFIVSDLNQCITVDLMDEDIGTDGNYGLGVTTVRDLLSAGGSMDLNIVHKGKPAPGTISLSAKFYDFAKEDSSFSASENNGAGLLCGVATVLVAGAFGLSGKREELSPSVIVTWGEKHHFQTVIVTDTPGVDIQNPMFDSTFRVPITSDMVGSGAQSFKIALMNKKEELGKVEIPLTDVLKAPDMILQNKFDVGSGATVRASIGLRGITAAKSNEFALPQR